MGKGSGGGGHTPIEAPETGRSKQQIKILEIISEGEIEGLADGVKSVFLDKTPIQAADDSYNFNNLEATYNLGTQDQDILNGFNTSEREVGVGVEVKKNQPITRTITDSKTQRIRLTLGVKALFSQNDQGDTNGTSVDFKITIGSDVRILNINGKYSSQYLRSLELDNLPLTPFTIKVERLTADSKSNRLQNATIWASYTEIIDTEFAYPNTALVGIKFDSEYFNSIPTRNYEILGIKVKVPSNYDPKSRVYNGLWDGAFKIAWTDNPAWILYDILLNKRYGFGQRLGEFNVDKWALYAIAQYCDVLVPDGFGGKEPRFTCNMWLTNQRSAYDIINDICSIFRAIAVWTGTELTFIQDRPADPVWTYTNANVVDGSFERSYSAQKARHNIIHVEYLDKNANYETKIEYVSDDENVRKYGMNVKKVTAFGCTSRGQAHRTGLWILATEKLEKETITFTVGREGLMHCPGDIIRVADNHYSGTDIGGRVLAIDGQSVTLDREIELEENCYFSFIDDQAQHSSIKIQSVEGKVIRLDSQPIGLQPYAVWSISKPSIVSRLYRALSIAENDNGTYTITALQHEPQKENIVDNGAHFDPVATTQYKPPQIERLDVATGYDGKLHINTEIGSGDGTLNYDVRIIKDGTLYEFKRGLSSANLALDNLPNGDYVVVVYGKNTQGQIVSEKSQSFTINKPPAPTNVRAVGGLGEIVLEWDWVDDITFTEIFVSETDSFESAVKLGKVLERTYRHAVEGGQQTRYYWLRHVRGVNTGPFFQQQGLQAQSAVDLDAKLAELNEELSRNIVDDVINTALPARNLELTKTVESLDLNQFIGHKQVYNLADGKLYIWNGTKYVTDAQEILASAIQGIIQPSQLASIPTAQLSGTISANQIAANSIGTNALQANAVSADKIQANAITSAKIQTGAINANHISAGQISADKLAIGLGGNLLYNPIFATVGKNSYGTDVPYGWGYWIGDSTTFTGVAGRCEYRRAGGTDLMALQGGLNDENTVSFTRDIVRARNVDERVGWFNQDVRVNAGQTYIASCYLATHRGKVKIAIEKLAKDSNAYISYIGGSDWVIENQANALNRDINNYRRVWCKFTAPDTGHIRFAIQLNSIHNGTNPWAFALRPMLEECTEHATQPSAWVNAGVTSINGGSIKTRTITAEHLAANTITANEIASGAITANHIATNSISANHIASRAISADKLNVTSLSAVSSNIGNITAGSISGVRLEGNTINGNTITGGTITGTTISGGVIKGVRLEGATGKFTGVLEVTQLIGGGIIEHVTGNLKMTNETKKKSGWGNGMSFTLLYKYKATVTIAPARSDRYLTIEEHGISDTIPANTSKTYTLEKYFPPGGANNTSFLVKTYALSTKSTVTIS